ncbi:MAG: class I SAM-dependent methyltransferase [Actinomycetota bacterium]
MADASESILACPICHGSLASVADGARCQACGATFLRSHGFLSFPVEAGGAFDGGVRLEAYAGRQEATGERFYREFLRPWLGENPGRTLDAGCGVGGSVALQAAEGIDAWGVDLPKQAGFWADLGRDPARLVCGDVTRLPFGSEVFDAVLAVGVIEHIGTVLGHVTLAPDHLERRSAFARELVRVTRPGGRILVACPNKHFPADLHHGPSDAARPAAGWRETLSRRTGINLHQIWGDYHLLSFEEVRRLFLGPGGARVIRPVPARGYFAFGSVPPSVRGLARAWVERMPASMRDTFLNPFVIAEIRV